MGNSSNKNLGIIEAVKRNELTPDLLRGLMQSGADINERGKKGETAIVMAARMGSVAMVTALLDARADLFLVSPWQYNRTAAHWAALNNHLPLVHLLINRAPALFNNKDREGWRPVFLAARAGHAAIVRFLVLERSLADPSVLAPEQLKALDRISSVKGVREALKVAMGTMKCEMHKSDSKEGRKRTMSLANGGLTLTGSDGFFSKKQIETIYYGDDTRLNVVNSKLRIVMDKKTTVTMNLDEPMGMRDTFVTMIAAFIPSFPAKQLLLNFEARCEYALASRHQQALQTSATEAASRDRGMSETGARRQQLQLQHLQERAQFEEQVRGLELKELSFAQSKDYQSAALVQRDREACMKRLAELEAKQQAQLAELPAPSESTAQSVYAAGAAGSPPGGLEVPVQAVLGYGDLKQQDGEQAYRDLNTMRSSLEAQRVAWQQVAASNNSNVPPGQAISRVEGLTVHISLVEGYMTRVNELMKLLFGAPAGYGGQGERKSVAMVAAVPAYQAGDRKSVVYQGEQLAAYAPQQQLQQQQQHQQQQQFAHAGPIYGYPMAQPMMQSAAAEGVRSVSMSPTVAQLPPAQLQSASVASAASPGAKAEHKAVVQQRPPAFNPDLVAAQSRPAPPSYDLVFEGAAAPGGVQSQFQQVMLAHQQAMQSQMYQPAYPQQQQQQMMLPGQIGAGYAMAPAGQGYSVIGQQQQQQQQQQPQQRYAPSMPHGLAVTAGAVTGEGQVEGVMSAAPPSYALAVGEPDVEAAPAYDAAQRDVVLIPGGPAVQERAPEPFVFASVSKPEPAAAAVGVGAGAGAGGADMQSLAQQELARMAQLEAERAKAAESEARRREMEEQARLAQQRIAEEQRVRRERDVLEAERQYAARREEREQRDREEAAIAAAGAAAAAARAEAEADERLHERAALLGVVAPGGAVAQAQAQAQGAGVVEEGQAAEDAPLVMRDDAPLRVAKPGKQRRAVAELLSV